MIYYGGDYNPEQWEPQIIDEDIRLMKTAGVNLVTVAVFSWALLEPKEGQYQFGYLDELMDSLHAAGIGVDLATATASPPPWLGKLYPETLPKTMDGTPILWGSRQQYNPSSPKFRDAARRMTEQMANRYGSHPALKMWHVSNEYGCHTVQSFDDATLAAFRLWLQERYQSLERLNEVWGTIFWSQVYGDWEEIMAPGLLPSFHNPVQKSDWHRFCSDQLLECYLTEYRVLKKATPEIPITTNFMGFFPATDYWKWAENLDIISNDTYPNPGDPAGARNYAAASDLMRSLRNGQPFMQMEQATSAVHWRSRNTPKRPGQFRLWSLQLVARGADGVLQFQWRQSKRGSETFHSGMLPHAGTESMVWEEVVKLGRTLRKLAPLQGARVSTQVAILWDWQSAWSQESAIGPIGWDPFKTVKDWHGSLFEAGYTVDFVRPGQDLRDYSLIVVPAMFAIADSAVTPLRRAVSRGATVVVTAGNGYLDQDGQAYLGGYLGPLSSLLGVRVVDLLPSAPVDAVIDLGRITRAVQVRGTGTIRFGQASWSTGGWAERIAVDDAVVQGTYAGLDIQDLPAITKRTVAGGAAWYVGAFLDQQGRTELIEGITSQIGILPVLPGAPAGIEAIRRGDYLFLLNHSDQVVMVHGVSGQDLLSGSQADGSILVSARDGVVLDSPLV